MGSNKLNKETIKNTEGFERFIESKGEEAKRIVVKKIDYKDGVGNLHPLIIIRFG